MTPAEALGRAVAVYRTAKGYRRKHLCSAAAVSYPYLSEIENGFKEPSLDVLRRLAAALDMRASVLLAAAEVIQAGGSLL